MHFLFNHIYCITKFNYNKMFGENLVWPHVFEENLVGPKSFIAHEQTPIFGDSGTGRGWTGERIRGGDMPISTPYSIPKHFQKNSHILSNLQTDLHIADPFGSGIGSDSDGADEMPNPTYSPEIVHHFLSLQNHPFIT